jgi:hypothetical protein
MAIGSIPGKHCSDEEWSAPMPDLRQDLRATEESIHRDAEQMKNLEGQKEGLDPADPRLLRLSEQVERLAAGLQDKSVAERELVEKIQGSGAS